MGSKNKIIGGFVLLLLLVGVILTSGATQQQQTTESRAAKAQIIQILSPKPFEPVNQTLELRAQAITSVNVANLLSVVKVYKEKPTPLVVQRLDDQTVSLSGNVNTVSYKNGSYTLSVYLYDESSGKAVQIDKAALDFIVAH